MPLLRVCLHCGTSFTISPSTLTYNPSFFCGKPCYHAHRKSLPAIAQRFWSLVQKTDTCWLWTGNFASNGYGRFGIGYTREPAHRVAYALTYGPILPGLLCLHHCDTPACVRPEHLFLGTHADNMRDMARKKRHYSHTKPERYARGDRSGARLHPERWVRGERQWNAKLTEDIVRAIRRLHAEEQWTNKALADHFGVSSVMISKIVLRKSWRHVS